MIALMDQYLSFIETTATPYLLDQYFPNVAHEVSNPTLQWWKTLYFIPTFFIFLLNGLMDIIGRKRALLILISLFGLSALAIVYLTSTFHLFMVFFAIITFATVSNMWTVPISEEAPKQKRAKYAALVYVMSLIPLQAIIPPLVVPQFGWKWMYGVMFFFMIPVLVLWWFMKEPARYEVIKEERRLGIRKKHLYGIGIINRCDVGYIVFSAVVWACWLIVSMLILQVGYYFMSVNGYTLNAWSMILLAALLLMMAGGVAGGWTLERIGRKTGLTIGCLGLAFFVGILGFVPKIIAPAITAITGFFFGFSYIWILVYIPEIFPTERRGACMGWTTTLARVSYIAGPALSATLLSLYPKMDWFWGAAGLLMLLPVALVFLYHPLETKTKELEEIEATR